MGRAWSSVSLAAYLVVTSCSGQCDLECGGASVAIEDAVHRADTARICLDGDCEVVDVVDIGGSSHTARIWAASRPIVWRDDESMQLSIELFDSQGTLLASLDEERVMSDPESRSCRCASFAYRWDGKELSRQQ